MTKSNLEREYLNHDEHFITLYILSGFNLMAMIGKTFLGRKGDGGSVLIPESAEAIDLYATFLRMFTLSATSRRRTIDTS